MTTAERKIAHFHEHAPRCRPHGERPRYDFDGIHSIQCGKGCYMHCSEHAEPDTLMLKWDGVNRR